MPTVKVNDINMYYEIHGDGEPLVMIFGMGGEVSMLGFQPSKPGSEGRKPATYRWLVFDNRGTGRTDKPDTPYTVEVMAEDTIGLLNVAGIERAHFFGTSLGTYVSLVIAARYPERVKSLVLASAAARSASPEEPAVKALYDQLRLQLSQPGFLEKTARYPPTVRSILRQLDAVEAFDARHLLGNIKAPTLIVNGTGDQAIPVKYARELADGIEGSKLILVEGDHMFSVTRPELLLGPMYGFLAEVDSQSIDASSGK